MPEKNVRNSETCKNRRIHNTSTTILPRCPLCLCNTTHSTTFEACKHVVCQVGIHHGKKCMLWSCVGCIRSECGVGVGCLLCFSHLLHQLCRCAQVFHSKLNDEKVPVVCSMAMLPLKKGPRGPAATAPDGSYSCSSWQPAMMVHHTWLCLGTAAHDRQGRHCG